MSLFQKYFNEKFSDVYPDFEKFESDYNTLGFPNIFREEATLKLLYVLLCGRYANSTIANSDLNQFKYALFSIVWQYGGTWEKRVEIQRELRELSLDDGSAIYIGAKAIYNSAVNPGTEPSTTDLEELPFINNQNTTGYKTSKLDGLMKLYELLKTDVTSDFLNKFKDLFIKIAIGTTKYYVSEEN